MTGCYDDVHRGFQALSMRDHIQMLGQPETGEEAEEPVGLRILEFYISFYLRDNGRHLHCHDPLALRLCCKSTKALIDATFTYAKICKDNRSFVSFDGEPTFSGLCRLPTHAMIPNSSRSLKILCHTFPSLETLIVGDSEPFKGSRLPDSLGHLTFLKTLSLFNGEGRGLVLPQSFSQLTALEILVLKPSMNGIAPLQHCTSLRMLHLFLDSDYDEIPDVVCNLSSLEDLCFLVIGDYPCSVPTSLTNLKKLTSLELGIQNINQLPESLGDLSSLEWLEIRICKGLRHLPKSFSKLTALDDLRIASPSLKALPDSLGNLKQLTNLELSECYRLREIPHSISGLHRLQSLKVDLCLALTTLPESFGNLKSLKTFRLFRCPEIETLPDSLTQLSSLKLFNMYPRLYVPTMHALERHFYNELTFCGSECGVEPTRW